MVEIASISIEEAARRLGGKVYRDAKGPYVLAPGPGHSDGDESLSVRLDPSASDQDGFLVYSFCDDDVNACRDHVRDRLGLPAFKPKGRRNGKRATSATSPTQAERAARAKAANARATEVIDRYNARAGAKKTREPVAVYDYTDADGTLLYQKLKFEGEPKYGQRQPDGNDGWIQNLNGVKRVLYRLRDVSTYDSATAIVCEGEKDTDTVASLGLCATSADSGTWEPDLIAPLRGRDVIIVPDFDSTGVKRALEAANALYGVAASIRMIFLPGLTGAKGNKDVSDWLDQDSKRANTFAEICLQARLWTPDSDIEGMAAAAKIRTATARKSKRSDPAADHDDDDDGRPSIQITAGEIAPMATRAEELLIAAGVPLYQRGGILVRPIIETVDASHGRTTQIAQLKTLDITYMRDLLCRYINWLRYDGRKRDWVRTDPPLVIAAIILARAGDWKVPAIAGVISTPTMRPDGSLLTEAGFDAATRLLLVAPPAMPPIPIQPTRDDALAALTRLENLLIEFPFVDDAAKAVALSAMITPVVRGAFPVTPMHVARAPTSGSGKSYLWDIVAAIVIGQLMPVMAAGRTEEETEKRLGAALVAALPLISIDNVNGELGGDALCQTIERPNIKIRILGKSEQASIEARGTSTFASGNNIIIVGDVCRRVITVTLDPQLERPELREFRSNPVATVLADRGAYIAACLTICRAYIAAGRPTPARKLASFEGWSDTVRSALIWLGKADCVDSMETSREEDPERNELRAMLTAWSEAIGVGPKYRLTLAKVLEIAAQTLPIGYSKEAAKHPDLNAAVHAVATRGQSQHTDIKALGRWMQKRKGRVIDGMCFMVVSNPKGGSKWWVEDINAPHRDEDNHEDQFLEEGEAD